MANFKTKPSFTLLSCCDLQSSAERSRSRFAIYILHNPFRQQSFYNTLRLSCMGNWTTSKSPANGSASQEKIRSADIRPVVRAFAPLRLPVGFRNVWDRGLESSATALGTGASAKWRLDTGEVPLHCAPVRALGAQRPGLVRSWSSVLLSIKHLFERRGKNNVSWWVRWAHFVFLFLATRKRLLRWVPSICRFGFRFICKFAGRT